MLTHLLHGAAIDNSVGIRLYKKLRTTPENGALHLIFIMQASPIVLQPISDGREDVTLTYLMS